MVDGVVQLDLANDVDALAAAAESTILYSDDDGANVDTVTVLDGTANEMTVAGIVTSDDDVKLIIGDAAGENLSVNAAINLGAADLMLDVAGDATQTAGGVITAVGLALMVDGSTTLSQLNDVDALAAATDGSVLFSDADDLAIDAVVVLDGLADEMTVTGILTSDDDVKLIVGDAVGENLSIDEAVAVGGGDLFLDVAGEVTQTAIITGAGLALMVDGNVTLDLANDIDTLAADVGGAMLFNDVDGYLVGTVTALDGTADEMTLMGLTSDGDLKLITAGNLSIDVAVDLGANDLFLDVGMNVTQTATITAAGLALMVDGNTTLGLANDVDGLAVDALGPVLFNDVDDLAVTTVVALDGTPAEMTITGVTTADADVLLRVGDAAGENLTIDEAIAVGAAELLLDVAGDATQTAVIAAMGLALMVDGAATLELANEVEDLAADSGGSILYADADDVDIDTVVVLDGTAEEVTVMGLATSGDDVLLRVGDAAGENLTVAESIDLGGGDLLLDVAGSASQTGTITAAGLALAVDEGVEFDQANDVDAVAADSNGSILFSDVDGANVGSVTVLDGTAGETTVTGIVTSDDDVRLNIGDAAGENLGVNAAINVGAAGLLLDVAGNATQAAAGTITGVGLALLVDGNTTLLQANDVDALAVDVGGSIAFSDSDGLAIDTVEVLNGLAGQEMVVGATASALTIDTVAGNLAVNQPVEATLTAVTLDAGDSLLITNNVTARGQVELTAQRESADSFVFTAGAVTAMNGTAAEASVGPDLFQFINLAGVGPKFSALDMSNNITFPPITSGGTATIEIVVDEGIPISTFQVEIDWREATLPAPFVSMVDPFQSGATPEPVGPDPNLTPPGDKLVQVNSSDFDAAQVMGVYEHVYFDNPDGIDSPFILVPVRVSEFAGGNVDINIGADDLQNFVQQPGSLRDQFGNPIAINLNFDTSVGIMTVVVLDVLEFQVAISVPLPAELPIAPPLSPQMTPLPPPAPVMADIADPATLPNTAGLTGQTEERFYELRIVSFNQDGKLVETLEQRLNLSEPELQAIAPFNPSRLPDLFKRLPGDRYRLYLFEDGAERLILEFVIERVGDEGRPVELPSRVEGEPLEPSEAGDLDVPAKTEEDDPVGDEPIPAGAPKLGDASPISSPGADRFAEELSRASFVSSGGLVFGAALVSSQLTRKRAADADRRMAAFRWRQRVRADRKLNINDLPARQS